MRRVRLVHWNAAEAKERAADLRAAGYAVDWAPVSPETLRKLADLEDTRRRGEISEAEYKLERRRIIELDAPAP